MTATAARARRAPHLTAGHRATTTAAVAVAPTLVAAVLAAAYLVAAPPSTDLAAQLFRARLGTVLWNNDWYAGHPTPGYSVLMPLITRLVAPQAAAALAAVASAAVFAQLAQRHFGPGGRSGAVLFAAATAIDLYTGRLTLAVGALPALGAVAALDAQRPVAATALAILTGLCSPVAALFTAVAAAGHAVVRWRADAVPGIATAAGALVPVLAVQAAFPTAGSEPFAPSAFLPLIALCAAAIAAVPAHRRTLRAGIALYGAATTAAYVVPSPLGGNVTRLGTCLALPLAALLWWPARRRRLALVALPLLYIGWQAPVADVLIAAHDASTRPAYDAPLLRFLTAQPGVFRTEVVFTRVHWEALYLARRVLLARGWERQVDIGDDPLFYDGRLTATAYARWLHDDAVRFVALPDVALDPSAIREAALIRSGLPYLHPVLRLHHWRVYRVAGATPLATGAAQATAVGTDWVALTARRPGTTTLRVRFSPYWTLTRGNGCVAPAGPFTRLTLRRPGPVRLAIRFSPWRIGATAPRCGGRPPH